MQATSNQPRDPRPRDPQPPDPQSRDAHPAVIDTFRTRTVLITGAAGSIGSELARQVAALPVARLLLFDRDENSMFELMRSFEARGAALATEEPPGPSVTVVLGDIRDRELVRETFAKWQPEIVLHAAAYKHVPMMESNPCEAVLNNVTGSRILADAAIEAGCERFLLISTDKAVEPTSVMGATKRLAELLLQERAAGAGSTLLASVRFVNVIGSRGSVIPIFLDQIVAGGPVTVTHEEMTRYFMSLEQAARLLLEAATLPDSGSIYALEMGDPVKIVDLARGLIEGLVPGKDIAIEVIGMRPGEKLREQLHGAAESLRPTEFAGIDLVESVHQWGLDPHSLAELESAAQRRDSARVIELLQGLPVDYQAQSLRLATEDATPVVGE